MRSTADVGLWDNYRKDLSVEGGHLHLATRLSKKSEIPWKLMWGNLRSGRVYAIMRVGRRRDEQITI